MARYIDCEKCYHRNVCQGDTDKWNYYGECPHYINTADVVPKSEVDLYKRQVDELEDELAQTYDKLETAKTEVAREIFEEIEEARERWEAIYSSDHFGYGGGAYGYLETDVDHTIYELKKKYTERNNAETNIDL